MKISTVLLVLASSAVFAQTVSTIRTGRDALGDWRTEVPGVWRKVTTNDLPPPFATASAGNESETVDRPAGAAPKVLAGFTVTEFAHLEAPRLLRTAPNGDVFVAETRRGQIRVLRAKAGAAKADAAQIFARGLDRPFGIAFYPAADPKWVYVANNNSVVRFPYQAGDLTARGAPQTVIAKLSDTSSGHSTRDIGFSKDGKRMFVSVGSGSNVGETLPKQTDAQIRQFESTHALGASWGDETRRADVLVFDPEGRNGRIYATGIRNCAAMPVHPETGDVWCATNERDGLGDDLVPDYITRVKEGAFYGWPWYYLGDHNDPRHPGERKDLAGKITVPDVLFQSHSAPLGLTFYPSQPSGVAAFPADFRGDAFVTLHGSWNRANRTGYKVVRVHLKDGVPQPEYQDFMTGFVVNGRSVWGRPTGVAVAADGALLVTDDASSTVWRVAPSNVRVSSAAR